MTSNRQDGIDSFPPALPCKHIYKPGNGSRDSVRITVKCVKKSWAGLCHQAVRHSKQQGVLGPSARQGMPCSSSIFRWKWQQKAAQVCCSSPNPWWNGSSFASIRGAGHHPQDDQLWASLETSMQGRYFFLWPRDSSFCRELLRGAGRLGRGIELWAGSLLRTDPLSPRETLLPHSKAQDSQEPLMRGSYHSLLPLRDTQGLPEESHSVSSGSTCWDQWKP